MALHPNFHPTEDQRAECAILMGRINTAMHGLPEWRSDRLRRFRGSIRNHLRGDGKLLARWLNDYRAAIESELTSAGYWQRSSIMAR